MFKIVIESKNTNIFKKIFESLKEVLVYTNINFTPEGLSLSSMDDSHVIMAVSKIKKTFFCEYNVSETEKCGINLNSLVKILKVLDVDEDWEIEYQDTKLDISAGPKAYTLTLFDLEAEDYEDFKFDYYVNLKLETNILISCLKDLSIYDCEELEIRHIMEENQEYMVWQTKSEEGLSKYKWDVEKDLLKQLKKLNLKDSNRLLFNLKYIHKICKISVCSEVRLKLSSDVPMCVSFKGESYKVNYYLAPKIDEDSY